MHGGATPRGIDHPRTKLSRYRGIDLPAKIAERYWRAMRDPELTSLQQELGLIDARVAALIDTFPTRESASAWARVTSIVGELGPVVDDLRPDPTDGTLPTGEALAAIVERFDVRMSELRDAISSAASERSTWHEVVETLEVRRRLVDTERRREEALQVSLTMRQGVALIGTIVAAIAEEVTDPTIRLRLASRLRALLASPASNRSIEVGDGSDAAASGAITEDDGSEQQATQDGQEAST